jgi:hypothetical protein
MRAYLFHKRAAGQSLTAVNDHRARSAHPNAAGEAKRKIRAGAALERKKCVQNARLFTQCDPMSLEVRLGARFCWRALHTDFDFRHPKIIRREKLRCNQFRIIPRLESANCANFRELRVRGLFLNSRQFAKFAD